MTLADDLLPTVYAGRAIAGAYGFRTTTVTLRFEYASSDDAGAMASTDHPLLEANGQSARIVRVKGEDVPFGNAPSNVLRYGPITPKFSGGGTDVTLFTRTLDEGESRILILRGPEFPEEGERYRLLHVDALKPLRVMLFLQSEAEALDGYT